MTAAKNKKTSSQFARYLGPVVDGEKLAGMLEKLELGLKPRHTFELDGAFFDEYTK